MRRTLVAVALAASSLTAGRSGLAEPLWRLLSSLWNQPATKEGPGWDPFGQHAPPPPDAGAGWDPNGLSAPTPPPTDEGAGWDPNG